VITLSSIRDFILHIIVGAAIASPLATMITLYHNGNLGDAWSRGWWLILSPLFVGVVIVFTVAAYEVLKDE